jgi:hypothetical protein
MSGFSARVISIVGEKNLGFLVEIEIDRGQIGTGEKIIWDKHEPVKVEGLQMIWHGASPTETGETSTGLIVSLSSKDDLLPGTVITDAE